MQLRVQLNCSAAFGGKLFGTAVNVAEVGAHAATLLVEHTFMLVALIVIVGGGAGVTVTVAVPDFVGSATEVAVTVMSAACPPPGTDTGAVYMPVLSIDPQALLALAAHPY
jgi:hypothetical protein